MLHWGWQREEADGDVAVGEFGGEAADSEVHEGRHEAQHAQHHAHVAVAPPICHLCEDRQPIYVRLRSEHTHTPSTEIQWHARRHKQWVGRLKSVMHGQVIRHRGNRQPALMMFIGFTQGSPHTTEDISNRFRQMVGYFRDAPAVVLSIYLSHTGGYPVM